MPMGMVPPPQHTEQCRVRMPGYTACQSLPSSYFCQIEALRAPRQQGALLQAGQYPQPHQELLKAPTSHHSSHEQSTKKPF